MKKINYLYAVALALGAEAALAQEQRENTVWDRFSGFLSPDWKRDFSVSLGVKIWLHEWRRDSFFFNTPFIDIPSAGRISAFASDDKPNAQTSDGIEVTPIPQLALKYKWLFLSGSYYPETDFNFSTTESSSKIELNGIPIVNVIRKDSASAERYEWDAAGGIYIHKYIAILGGYKKIHQDITLTFDATAIVPEGLPGVEGGKFTETHNSTSVLSI